jgi:ABC-2 type transport system permease protein
MRDNLRLYFRYLGISVRGQMQYRGSFLMLAAGSFLMTGMEFAFIWVLFDRFGSLQHWRLEEVALIYGMVHVAFALAEAFARGFDIFDRLVKNGDFDRVLLRPRSAALQVASQELQLMRIGRLSQGLLVLAWAVVALDVAWAPARALLLMAAILSGACVFSGLFILYATLAFWTTESLEIVNTVTYGGVETAQFPISIYRPWFRRFFTFVVPLATMNYLPAHAILGKADALGSPALLQWASPLAGFVFLAVCLRLFALGMRHYSSTGS